MTASIPASEIVSVIPNVISAGGTGLDLDGLLLSDSTQVPIGDVLSFATAADVSSYFGAASAEAALAAVYFGGFDNSNIKPAALLIAQYPTAAVPAYLRGGSVAALTLTELKAIAGTLSVDIDGQTATGTIDLSAVTSFSNAAAAIQTALANYDAVGTATGSGTDLTIASVASGTFAPGQAISGTGIPAGTTIVSQTSGTIGGAGVYVTSQVTTISADTVSAGPTQVTYDSIAGAFVITGGTPGVTGAIAFATGTAAAALKLTAATGAVLSQGADIAVPGTFMAAVIGETQNFATFWTSFKPSTADMVAFAQWTNSAGNRYGYLLWDDDIVNTQVDPSSTAYAQILLAAYSGTFGIYDPSNGASLAAFVAGSVASLDFTETNGRATLAFRSLSGLTAGVTNASIAAQLKANGLNFYGSYATANDNFVFLYPGQVSGAFEWMDSYVNQIWLNNSLQLALMTLLTSVKSVPYNALGYGLIEAAMLDPVNAALNFGAIRAGVTLSSLQQAEVNAAAGLSVADTIQQRGWYIQVKDASATTRQARESPPITLWYTDGQSVQQINVVSAEIQ